MADLGPIIDLRQSPTALKVQRGVMRLLRTQFDFCSYAEVPLINGRRADVLGVGPKGEIWIVEIKSSVADFRSDAKWPDYADYCDRFLFAVPTGFPTNILPAEPGLILADSYGAALMRDPPEHRLAGARRKAVLLRFAHAAANRHHALIDPEGARGWMD